MLRPLATADNPGEDSHGSQEQSRTGEEGQLRQGQNGGQGIAEQDDGLEHNNSQPFCEGAGFSRALLLVFYPLAALRREVKMPMPMGSRPAATNRASRGLLVIRSQHLPMS